MHLCRCCQDRVRRQWEFNYRTFPVSSAESAAGGAPCTTGEFKDPIDGVVKGCYYQYALPYGSDSQLGTWSGGGLTSTGGKFSVPGEPNGSIPPLNPQTADTFTVNAGGTSCTVSQPNDSVATCTWTKGGAPSEVLTSATGSGLGYALSNVSIGTYSGAIPSDSITVDPNTTYQTIDGFGGAMTDSAASLTLGSANSSQIMQTLFGTNAGQAGLTTVRSPMGSSDMMAASNDIHTYEDTQGSFSVSSYASDQRQITTLQEAKAIAGSNFKILGTPGAHRGGRRTMGPYCRRNVARIRTKSVPPGSRNMLRTIALLKTRNALSRAMDRLVSVGLNLATIANLSSITALHVARVHSLKILTHAK